MEGDNDSVDINMRGGPSGLRSSRPIDDMDISPEESPIEELPTEGGEMEGGSEMISQLPSPADLGIDMTDTANM